MTQHLVKTDKKGRKYLELGMHWDRLYILRKRRNIVLAKPFSGGSLNRPDSGDYRIYNLNETVGDCPRMIAEFPRRKDAIDYFNSILFLRRYSS